MEFKLRCAPPTKPRVSRLLNGRIDPISILKLYNLKENWYLRDIVRIERIAGKYRSSWLSNEEWDYLDYIEHQVSEWRRIKDTRGRLDRKTTAQRELQTARIRVKIRKYLHDRETYLLRGVRLYKTYKAQTKQVNKILGADARWCALNRRAKLFKVWNTYV